MRALLFLLAGAVASFAVAESAHACGPRTPGKVVTEFLGWTTDGRYLAYEYNGSIGEHWEEEAHGRFVGVLDTENEETVSYVVSIDADGFGPEDKELQRKLAAWKMWPKKAAFDKWLENHPLKQSTNVQSCASAKLVVELEDVLGYADTQPTGSWKNNVFSYQAEPAAVLELGVEVGGKYWKHGELLQQRRRWTGSYEVGISWSPNCDRIAWRVVSKSIDQDPTAGMWDGGYYAAVVGSPFFVGPVGPNIHVMAHESAIGALEPVVDALGKAGLPAHRGPNALKARDKTVVYAWSGAKDEAGKVASLIPGGASVDKITWRTEADIIVAVGQSAAQ